MLWKAFEFVVKDARERGRLWETQGKEMECESRVVGLMKEDALL